MSAFGPPTDEANTGSRPALPVPPRAEVLALDDLVRSVLAGQIRIPDFQRKWNWDAADVRLLLDSLYRGYPVGSLLMWRRPREAETLTIGPCTIVAGARSDAWAVIDGQQRLTTIVGTLARPDDPVAGRADVFAVWFDPETERFAGPDAGEIPETWVPVTKLLDTGRLQDFVIERAIFSARKDLRQRVFEAGKRLREYRIPIYVVETDTDVVPRDIFYRTNRTGKQIKAPDVFHALTGTSGTHPAKLEDLQGELRALGMGVVPLQKLLQCVMSVHGLDVTRRFDEQQGDVAGPVALARTAPAIRSALAFLREQARIPHLRVLPYPVPLIVLARFFALHPEPPANCLTLLIRWVWRGMLSRAHEHGERTALRDAVRTVAEGDPEHVAIELLRRVPRTAAQPDWWLDVAFDGRAAASRIAELWIVALRPLDPLSGRPLDVGAILDERGSEAFRPMVKRGLDATLARSPANRVILPPSVGPAALLELAGQRDTSANAVLASHGFDHEARVALASNSPEGRVRALSLRREALRAGVADLGRRLAAWDTPDRRSIRSLLEGAEDEA